MSDTDPVTKVARDLTEILRLYADLEEQAINDSANHLMPGGRAMVELGPVSNLERWEFMTSAGERLGRAYTSAEDEDPDEAWSAFQLIEFWSEDWRRTLDAEYEGQRRPTIATEANFVRHCLEWARDNELRWDDFAHDINRARVRLEDILTDGERSERGAPCLYDECKGSRLVRKLLPGRDKDGRKVWRHTNWHCVKCHREWDDDGYARHVTAANERTKFEEINGELWGSVEYAARVTKVPAVTLRVWLHRGVVDRLCLVAGRRQPFVRISEVRSRREKQPSGDCARIE